MLYKLPPSAEHIELARRFPRHFSLSKGLPVEFRGGVDKGFEWVPGPDSLVLRAATASDRFRALGELMAYPAGEALRKRRVLPPMDFRGLMVDASRNGVMRAGYFKSILPDLALMGFSHFCFYTEDTFEVEGHPLIGYRRGRYGQDE